MESLGNQIGIASESGDDLDWNKDVTQIKARLRLELETKLLLSGPRGRRGRPGWWA